MTFNSAIPTRLASPFGLQSPFGEDGRVHWLIRFIFEQSGTPLSEHPDLDELVEKSQQWNSSTKNKLRWDLPEVAAEAKLHLWPAFGAARFIDPWYAVGRKKHQALVGGCTVAPFLRRLASLDDYILAGGQIDEVVLLGSDRPAYATAQDDPKKLLARGPATRSLKDGWTIPTDAPYAIETDVLRLCWESTQFKSSLADMTPTVIDARHPNDTDGKFAGTEEQIAAWLRHEPNPGDVLLVSSQPHCHFQHAIFARALLDVAGTTLETIGCSANYGPGTNIDVLGGISRWLLRLRELWTAASMPRFNEV